MVLRRANAPPPAAPSEGASLEQLAAAADQAQAGAAPADALPPSGQVAAPTIDEANFNAIGFLLTAFRMMAGRVLKVQSLELTLNDANVVECARVLAPVATKYGIDLGVWAKGPEGLALITAGPILWRAYAELDAELKARRAPVPAAPGVPAASVAAPLKEE